MYADAKSIRNESRANRVELDCVIWELKSGIVLKNIFRLWKPQAYFIKEMFNYDISIQNGNTINLRLSYSLLCKYEQVVCKCVQVVCKYKI